MEGKIQWVKTSDDVPKDGTTVICAKGSRVFVATYRWDPARGFEVWLKSANGVQIKPPDHWAHLPEAPGFELDVEVEDLTPVCICDVMKALEDW